MEGREQRDLLDKYVYNTLSDAERNAIEELKKKDPVFKEQIEFEERLKDSTVFDHINELNHKASIKEKGKVIKRKFLLSLLALFTMILLLLWYFKDNNPIPKEKNTVPIASINHLDIYSKYLAHKPNFLQTEGASFFETADYQKLKEWLEIYEVRNYIKAEKLLSQYESIEHPYQLYAQFYLGQVFLHLKKSDEAVKIFKEVINNSERVLNPDKSIQNYIDSESYLGLGLAYILKEDLINAQLALEKIQHRKNIEVKAQTILQEIKQSKNN